MDEHGERTLMKENYRSFIGKHADSYLARFERFTKHGTDTFAFTWHWPAFLVPFPWMLYRKLYWWAVVALLMDALLKKSVVLFHRFDLKSFVLYLLHPASLVLGLLGTLFEPLNSLFLLYMHASQMSLSIFPLLLSRLLPRVLFGLTGYYLYYTHAKKKILQVTQVAPSFSKKGLTQTGRLAATGGVSVRAFVIGNLVPLLVILSCIILPNLLIMIQKSKSSHTAADMRAIGTALGSYWVDYGHYPVSPPDVFSTLDNLGYYTGATNDGWGHELFYHSNDGTTYTLTSYGKDGKKGGCDDGYEWECDIIYCDGQFVAPARYRQ
jgi:hypothetical protein